LQGHRTVELVLEQSKRDVQARTRRRSLFF
jgi:hypothetical protein